MIKTFYFLALLFAALALGPAMAHLLELPNKINLARYDYMRRTRKRIANVTSYGVSLL